MSKIESVDALIERLDNAKGKYETLKVLQSLDIPEQEFERYYHWSDEHYTRNQLVERENYELVIICWEKGQQSSIHDYDTNEAWIHPLRGQLREEKFVLDDQTGELHKVSNVVLGVKDYTFMGVGVDLHRYTNVYDHRATSLHLYSKPVKSWRAYDEANKAWVEKEVWWDSVNEWEPQTN